jgi:sporulation protein YlmC with PRC-barrel domain
MTLERHLQSNTVRASKLIGMELQSRSGDNLGEVADVVQSAPPGRDMELIVAVGGLAGADEKLIAVPFDDVEINADGDELYTRSTRDQLAATPPAGLERRGGADGQARPDSAGAQARTASLNERRMGDLLGAEVVGSNGEAVGEVEDIVISTAATDNLRAVLQVGGLAGIGEKRVALPFEQLQIQRVGDGTPNVQVGMDRESLERQPEFEYDEQTSAL